MRRNKRLACVFQGDETLQAFLRTILERLNFEVHISGDPQAFVDGVARGRYTDADLFVIQVAPLASPIDQHQPFGLPVLECLLHTNRGLLKRTVVLTTTQKLEPPFHRVCAVLGEPFDLRDFVAAVRHCSGSGSPRSPRELEAGS